MRQRTWTFLRQYRTCRGQRLRPLNDFLISTKHLRYPTYRSNRVLTWTRPSNLLRSTMDVPIALLQKKLIRGHERRQLYSLKSRLLHPFVLPKDSLNNRAYHISIVIDYQKSFRLRHSLQWVQNRSILLPLLRLIPPMERFPTSYHRKWYIAKNYMLWATFLSLKV